MVLMGIEQSFNNSAAWAILTSRAWLRSVLPTSALKRRRTRASPSPNKLPICFELRCSTPARSSMILKRIRMRTSTSRSSSDSRQKDRMGPMAREVRSQPASGVVADPDLVGERESARGLTLRIGRLPDSLKIVCENARAFPLRQSKSVVGSTFKSCAIGRGPGARTFEVRAVLSFCPAAPERVVIDAQSRTSKPHTSHDHVAGVLACSMIRYQKSSDDAVTTRIHPVVV